MISAKEVEELVNIMVENRLMQYENKQTRNSLGGETNMDLKKLKAALFEVEMFKAHKDVPYIEYSEIKEIVTLINKGGNKLNLSPDALEFYMSDIKKAQGEIEAEEKKAKQEQAAESREQAERDSQEVIKIIKTQNDNLPYQLRQSEEQIKQAVKQAMGNFSAGDLSYRKRLAALCGGKLKDDWNTVEVNEKVLAERLIQDNFNKQQAEKKAAE